MKPKVHGKDMWPFSKKGVKHNVKIYDEKELFSEIVHIDYGDNQEFTEKILPNDMEAIMDLYTWAANGNVQDSLFLVKNSADEQLIAGILTGAGGCIESVIDDSARLKRGFRFNARLFKQQGESSVGFAFLIK